MLFRSAPRASPVHALMPLSLLLETVRRACELCRRVRAASPGAHHQKGDTSPVTLADYGVQALVGRTLARQFPGEGVIAEESAAAFLALPPPERERGVRFVAQALGEPVGEADVVRWLDHGRGVRSPRTWVIDPIDGTEGFVHGRAYAVCVGSLVGGEPREGIIGAPVSPLDASGTLFYSDGGGAWAEPLEGGPARVLRVSDREDPESLRAVESYLMGRRSREVADRVYAAVGLDARRVRRYDSMLKYALVAAGAADVFLRGPRDIQKSPHHAWDHVAGAALVHGAGGRVTGLEGEPLDFGTGVALRNRGVLVSNGRAHARLVQAFARVNPGEEPGGR